MQQDDNLHWFKKAIVYSLDVRSFKDGNEDGIGDLKGLVSKFDHLVRLGINCIWMTPFYCSNNQDDGYDVLDYCRIDPVFGDFDDFEHLVKKAKAHGVKIILDLVINHTSIAHPWFKRAVEQPRSVYRDYYIWKKDKPENDREDVVFETVEDSNWEYHPQASAYFYHTFYKHQPDLNIVNPRVRKEILKIIDFWMAKGIDGFRIDAVPHILRNKGDSEFEGDPFDLLDAWQKAVKRHNPAAILIGEADVEPEDYPSFYQDNKLNGLFNFFLNNYLFLALAKGKATPLVNAFRRLPDHGKRPYLNFIRNHDELDLERLTEADRLLVIETFAPDPSMVIYDRGIRRRLPPMVHDQSRVRLAFSLLLTFPGVPVIRYGEEIGMGDDLNLPERKSVRTAMQWSQNRNAGFSDVVPQAMQYPLIRQGCFSYEHINVEAQEKEDESLLRAVRKMIYIRDSESEFFAHGRFSVLKADNDAVLAYQYQTDDQLLLVLHNFGANEIETTIDPIRAAKKITALFGQAEQVVLSGEGIKFCLTAHSYCWCKIQP